MKNGEAATAPQGRNSLEANLVLLSPGEVFDLWVDNRRVFSGTRIECEHFKDSFADEFGIPDEKFTFGKVEQKKGPKWVELSGRKFIDLGEVF